jgi:type II secretory pathway pseudopilin PulG
MSTGLIIAIAVAAVLILALLVLLPRMRSTAQRKKAERELHSRRERVADEHRSAAAERENRAEMAEQKARMAEQAAQRERAEANLQSERAEMHEQGRADHELIDESERDRFEGVTPAADDRSRAADMEAEGAPTSSEYERGREDERRFERERITDDVRESERR